LKKITPYFLFFISILLATYLWDQIKLPFSLENSHIGDNYAQNEHHSQNDTLRFIIFLSIPFLTLISYYQINEKKFFKNINHILNNYENENFIKLNKLNLFLWLTLIIILLEFFLIDFKNLDHHIDIFHEGLWLTPSINASITSEFWQSSYIERGFFGNFYPYLLWKFFELETIGLARFFNIFTILLNKFLLLLIAYRVATTTDFDENKKIIFYLVLSITLLMFTSYLSPLFFQRSFLLLLFMFLLSNFIILEKKKILNILLIGLFSSLSMFWYIDIGIYINVIILIFVIFLVLKKKIRFVTSLLLFVILGWFIFYYNIPKNEFNYFMSNSKSLILSIDYIHGLIFPTPFLSQDARSTKSLILFLITGFLILKDINHLNKDLKFIILSSFFFLISIVYFKYGLSRSDGGHIKIATSFLYIPFFSIIYYKIINLFFQQEKSFVLNPVKINYILLLIFIGLIFFNKKFENKNFINLFNQKNNIQTLVNYPDKKFINNDYQNFILEYKKLSLQDDCVMAFTNEVAIPYLLKKQTCSKYYVLYLATPLEIQKKIARKLKNKLPEYIIYKSDIDTYGHVGDRLILLDNFIKEKYGFYKKLSHWEIYRKK
jgi:hypothetical protein